MANRLGWCWRDLGDMDRCCSAALRSRGAKIRPRPGDLQSRFAASEAKSDCSKAHPPRDGINIVRLQSAGSNKALEFFNVGSIDFGSAAGSAALVAKTNRNSIKAIDVYSRPEWTDQRLEHGNCC